MICSGGSRRTTFSAVRLTSSPLLRAAIDDRRRVASAARARASGPAPRTSAITGCCERERAQPALEVRADRRARDRAGRGRSAARGRTRAARHGEQVAAVGAAVIAGRDRLRRRVRETSAAPTGTPRAERLADRDQVGRQAERLRVERMRRCGRARTALRRRSAACRSRRTLRRSPAANAGDSGRTPPSPWIGSAMIAAVRLGDGRVSAAGSSGSTNVTGPSSGWNGVAIVLVQRHRQRAHRAAGERVLERDELGALGCALRVPVAARELQARLDWPRCRCCRRTRAPARRAPAAARPLSPATGGSTGSTCAAASPPDRRCAAARPGCAWPSDGDADAREEVEVLAAVDVVETRALAAHERHRLAPVGLQHVLRFARLDVVECHVSSHHLCARRTCAVAVDARAGAPRARPSASRPLTITTSPTPASSAARQAAQLRHHAGLFAVPSPISASMPLAVERGDRLALRRRARPAVPPAMTAARAPSAAASAAASVSALTFSSWPPLGRRRCRRRPARSRARSRSSQQLRRAARRRLRRPGRGRPSRPATRAIGAARCIDRPTARRRRSGRPARTPRADERRDEPRVDRAGQHRDDDVERGASVTRRPSTCCFGDAAPRQRGVDLPAAAVHDDQRAAAARARRSPATTRVAGRRRARAARRRA